MNLVAHFDAEHVELQTQPERERGGRMAHGFEAKELLVEAPRLGNVAALQRAVSEDVGLIDRAAVLQRNDGLARDFKRHKMSPLCQVRLVYRSAVARLYAAVSACVRNASAWKAAGGSPHVLVKSSRAALTIAGAPHA